VERRFTPPVWRSSASSVVSRCCRRSRSDSARCRWPQTHAADDWCASSGSAGTVRVWVKSSSCGLTALRPVSRAWADRQPQVTTELRRAPYRHASVAPTLIHERGGAKALEMTADLAAVRTEDRRHLGIAIIAQSPTRSRMTCATRSNGISAIADARYCHGGWTALPERRVTAQRARDREYGAGSRRLTDASASRRVGAPSRLCHYSASPPRLPCVAPARRRRSRRRDAVRSSASAVRDRLTRRQAATHRG